MDGFYAATTAVHPYPDDASEAVRNWAAKYQAKFTDAPTVFSTYGYTMIDLFAKGLQKNGPQLTGESYGRALESMGELPTDIFGNPPLRFTPTQHLASNKARLSQLQNGRWKIVLDYDQFK